MMQTQLGAAATETMYVYECPLEHRRYWWTDNLTDEYADLPCEVCDASCVLVDSFEYVPWKAVETIEAAVEGDA